MYFLQNKYIQWGIIATIAFGIGFAWGYDRGRSHERETVLQSYIKQQQTDAKKIKDLTTQNNQLAYKLANESSNYELKFQEIQNDIHKTNDNLAVCRYNLASLRKLQSAAMPPHSGTSYSTESSSGRELAAYNCRDASETMIVWAKMYQQCRAQVVGWNDWCFNQGICERQ